MKRIALLFLLGCAANFVPGYGMEFRASDEVVSTMSKQYAFECVNHGNIDYTQFAPNTFFIFNENPDKNPKQECVYKLECKNGRPGFVLGDLVNEIAAGVQNTVDAKYREQLSECEKKIEKLKQQIKEQEEKSWYRKKVGAFLLSSVALFGFARTAYQYGFFNGFSMSSLINALSNNWFNKK